MNQRKPLTDLYPVAYEHPFDRQALDRLERTPGLELLTQKVLDNGLEAYLNIKHTGDNLRVTARNIPELHRILVEACSLLGMTEVPGLYLHLNDKIDSFSSGQKKRIIVLSSGAVDLLSDDELLFVLGRELGHIRSNHVLYREMADSLALVSQVVSDLTLGIGNLLSLPIKVALMHWYRMSEFTADRAGLLACQDIDVAAQAFIKMAGLPSKYYGRITTADFRQQTAAFSEIEIKSFDSVIRFIAGYENPQPFTVIRGTQLFAWVEEGAYQQTIERASSPAASSIGRELRCSACRHVVALGDRFCMECGFELPQVAASLPEEG